MSHVPGGTENIAYLTLFYDSSLLAHVHVNWLAPVKVRRTLIGGSRKMIMYDDVEPSEKVKVYDKGVTRQPQSKHSEKVYQMMVGYRAGDVMPLLRRIREEHPGVVLETELTQRRGVDVAERLLEIVPERATLIAGLRARPRKRAFLAGTVSARFGSP